MVTPEVECSFSMTCYFEPLIHLSVHPSLSKKFRTNLNWNTVTTRWNPAGNQSVAGTTIRQPFTWQLPVVQGKAARGRRCRNSSKVTRNRLQLCTRSFFSRNIKQPHAMATNLLYGRISGSYVSANRPSRNCAGNLAFCLPVLMASP